MPLENMSLAEALDLTSYLSTVVEVGKDLDALGYIPVFDMTPGEPICITILGHKVPDFAAHEDLFNEYQMLGGEREGLQRLCLADDAPVRAADEAGQSGAPAVETGSSAAEAPGLPSPQSPEPVADDAPPVAARNATGDVEQEPAGDDLLPAPAEVAGEQAPATEDGGGRSAVAEPAPAVSPQPPVWTVLEDDRLIAATVAKIVVHGIGKLEAIRQAAAEIGRPFESAKTRLYADRYLKPQFQKALAAAEAEKVAYEDAVKAAPATDKIAANPQSALDVHLFGLPRGGREGWDWLRDAELMRLSCQGFGIQDIAADLGMDSAAIKARFDLLTGNHKDADGKWHRRFAREDVLAAIEAQAGKAVL